VLPEQAALLVARAADGDERAWEALVEAYTPLLRSVARAHRLDDATTSDVVQTAWRQLVQHVGRLHDPGHVGAWLATTTKRECLRVLRQGQRERPTQDEHLDGPDVEADPLDAALLESERAVVVSRALAAIPARCQQLLRVLMTSPPPSYREVSAALDMPVGSIGPTRDRCLRKLRDVAVGLGLTAASLDLSR
jgi:RNA polymerase sigma factor (sigma-70 family)